MELITKLYSRKDKYSKTDYLISVLEEIYEANKNSSEKFYPRLIISLDKESTINEYEEILKIYNDMQNIELKKLIVGIDYSGNVNLANCREKKFEDILPFFEKFRENGLGISVHLGEKLNYQLFPLNLFIPDRISHCSFLKDQNIEELMKNNIHIEVCPTYSLKINRCIDYSEIVLKKLWKKNIKKENGEEFTFDKVSINSDCRTLIFTDISQEYYEIGLAFNLNINDLKQIINNTIDCIFEKDEEIHNKLKKILNNFIC